MGGLSSIGTYLVELDAGFLQDAFYLGTSTMGGTARLGGTTTFFDVTQYVTQCSIKRGRDSQDAQFGAATCVITIDDLKGQDKFSVANNASPYWNKDRGRLGFEPRRKVRVSRNGELMYYGFITAYDTEYSMDNHNIVTVRSADGFLNLSTTTISEFTPPAEKSGARIDRILALPEIAYPVDPLPSIATGVANLSPLTVSSQTALSYINKVIETAEQGRCYISRKGILTWESRTPKSTADSPTVTFGDTGTQIPYEALEVNYE